MGVTGQSSQSVYGSIKIPTTSNHKPLKCITWNLKRGLVTREMELKLLLENEEIDIAFITETDTKELKKESDYLISGYKTIFPNRENVSSKIRILEFIHCLIDVAMHARSVKLHEDNLALIFNE